MASCAYMARIIILVYDAMAKNSIIDSPPFILAFAHLNFVFCLLVWTFNDAVFWCMISWHHGHYRYRISLNNVRGH